VSTISTTRSAAKATGKEKAARHRGYARIGGPPSVPVVAEASAGVAELEFLWLSDEAALGTARWLGALPSHLLIAFAVVNSLSSDFYFIVSQKRFEDFNTFGYCQPLTSSRYAAMATSLSTVATFHATTTAYKIIANWRIRLRRLSRSTRPGTLFCRLSARCREAPLKNRSPRIVQLDPPASAKLGANVPLEHQATRPLFRHAGCLRDGAYPPRLGTLVSPHLSAAVHGASYPGARLYPLAEVTLSPIERSIRDTLATPRRRVPSTKRNFL
jgi:hypothetical protein